MTTADDRQAIDRIAREFPKALEWKPGTVAPIPDATPISDWERNFNEANTRYFDALVKSSKRLLIW